MALMPEPRMQETQQPDIPITKKLVIPLKDINFKKLMQFLFAWSLVSNLAIPFFTVYMLQRLGLPLSWVIALSILSQILNIFFLRVWGPLVDKFGNKVILSLCSSLYLLVIFGWIFVAMPERHFLTLPLLVVLHGFAGIASAGITLTASTIGLKMAPSDESTSYLAGASLATNLGTGLGPLAGGLLADYFGSRHLNLTFNWTDPAASFQFQLITLNGLDFLFGIAFIIGIPVLGLLATIREQGEVSKEEVLESLMTQAREFSRPISSGMSFNLLSYFPLINLKHVPLVGLDVALGVTIYQFAHMAKMASLASIHSRNIIIKMLRVLEQIFIGIWRYGQINMEMDGVAVAREAAYQAINTQGRMPLDVDSLENAVMLSVVKAVSQAGARPEDAVLGASQGILRAAVEARIDPGLATYQIIKIAEAIAPQIGLSREKAVNNASEGVMIAAREFGADIAEQIEEKVENQVAIIK
jgi:MFS family permease